jgi:hypothetical protein
MNLTSVDRAKSYLGMTSNGSDTLVGQLIARESDHVIRWCSRPFQRTSRTNARYNGTGTDTIRLPDTPIITVSALTIDGSTVAVSPDGITAGYQFDEFMVFLFGGYLFTRYKRNVGVDYVAGYTTSEASFVPAANGPYTLTPSTGGYANVDRGVSNTTSGVAYTLVGSTPLTGNYSYSSGVYTFNAADTGKAVTMSYDYVPGAVEQGVIELVGGDLKQRDNLTIASKSLRDESITYSDKDMSESVKGMLWPYRRIVPV